MTHFKFEGATEGIAPQQLEFIGSVLEERGFKCSSVQFQVMGKAGDNYMANVKRIVAEKDGETFKMIAKIAPTVETIRLVLKTELLFNNEHIMYTEVLPKFAEMQKQAGVQESERLRFATCYGSLTESPYEVILLEDLQVSDFVMLDRFTSFTDNEVKLVLKNFAILHSLSFALKRQNPELFADIRQKLQSQWVVLDQVPEAKFYFEQMEEDLMTMLSDDKYKNAVKGVVGNITTLSAKIHNIELESKYSVIQQGDCWTNNIMFRLMDDTAVQCCMIDYQISKVSSPVSDVHYMIFNCTDYETRSKHYNDWVDYYHSELDKCLEHYGLKASLVYPRDQLDTDRKTNAELSMALSVLLASVMLRECDDAEKLVSSFDSANVPLEQMIELSRVTSMDPKAVARFKERVEGILDTFFELGYL